MNRLTFCEDQLEDPQFLWFRLPHISQSLVVGSSKYLQKTKSPNVSWNWTSLKLNLILTASCWLCYYNALFCDFAFDDMSAIKQNQDLRPETPLKQLLVNDFWGQPMIKSYRPLCVLSFRLNYLVHRLRPFGYHLTNVILHTIVTLLYLRFCRLVMPLWTSFIAALLFSVHPIHTEAVTSVVGRAETLSALFFLTSLLAYARGTRRPTQTKWPWLLASLLASALATVSKEQGITAIAVCCSYEVVLNQKLHQLNAKLSLPTSKLRKILKASCPRWIKEMALRIAVMLACAGCFMAARLYVMQSQLPVFTRFDNPAAYSESPVRQLTHHYLFAFNAWLLLNPFHLCCDWTMNSIPLVHSLNDLRNLATLIFYLTLLALLWSAWLTRKQSHSQILLTSLSLMIIPFLPASNLFFPVGFVIAERVLYIPSIGFCMLVAHGLQLMTEHHTERVKRIIYCGLICTMLAHCARTILRNNDWQSEYNIFMSGIKTNPSNAKLYNNIGHVFETNGYHKKALNNFKLALEIQSDDIGSYINVGRAYANLNQDDLAEKHLSKAKDMLMQQLKQYRGLGKARIAPTHLSLFVNLANLISQNHSRLAEADQLYREAIGMRTDYVDAYINRGEVLLRLNRTADAESVYKAALHFDPNNADIYYNLGVVAIHLNKLNQAIAYFEKAITTNPNHIQALLNFAIVVQDVGKRETFPLAQSRLKHLLSLGENNERVYFNLAMIAMELGQNQDAEKWFKQALERRSDFRSANFNLALLLSETNRSLEAVPYLESLLHHYPQHIKGLTLLGDILINHSKDLDGAQECYQRILQLQPNNIQSKHNLCVVYLEKGWLDQAEQCLGEAAHIAPHQDYINRHLKIVRLRILKKRQLLHSSDV